MKKLILTVAILISLVSSLVPAAPINAQVANNLADCREFGFSVEQSFVSHGPTPKDGNPIISDGDLLGPNCVVCARNEELLRQFDISTRTPLGLDALDIVDIEGYLVAFSTELDSPYAGQFTAGDLLTTQGAVIPNVALMSKFGIRYDIGLDGIQLIGQTSEIVKFLVEADRLGRAYFVQTPTALASLLTQYRVDIWFTTEGTGPATDGVRIFDGDLLSARDGVIVVAQADLLPNSVPAGIPDGGVDFGLDAVATDRQGNRQNILFSTEILYGGTPLFTDGDLLRFNNGVVKTNEDLIRCFEPKSMFLGLDAYSVPDVPMPTCPAAILRIGGMAAGSVNALGLANGLSTTTPPFEAQNSPFGAWVQIIGLMPLSCPDCTEFKIEYAPWPNASTPPAASAYIPIVDPFQEWAFTWPMWWTLVDRTPNPTTGWLSILCNTTMGGLYMPWNTSGKNGKYNVRITVKASGGAENVSAPVTVVLDNIAPTGTLTFDTVPVCGDIFAGDVVTGRITATDANFYSYRLRYESSLASGEILPIRKYTGTSDTGDSNLAFSWNTAGLPACGYRVILEVWDRAIVNNGRTYGEPGFGWRTVAQVYFCLEAAR